MAGDDDNEDAGISEGLSKDYFNEATSKQMDGFIASAGSTGAFQHASVELSQTTKLALKVLYGFNSLSAPSWTAAASGLQELYVDGFDTEQIWGQLEASSGPLLKQLRKKWKGLGQDFQLLDENTEKALDDLLLVNGGKELSDSQASEGDDLEMDEAEEAEAVAQLKKAATLKRSRKRLQEQQEDERPLLPTEDAFLRLDDMERFVEEAEAAAMKGNDDEEPENEEDEDEDDEDAEGGSDFEGLDPRALGPSADQEANLGVDAESNSDEEDAELARLLESASGMAGRPNQISNGRKRQRIADLDEEEEDDGADYFYAEFFGPGGPSRADALLQEDGSAKGAKRSREGAEDIGHEGMLEEDDEERGLGAGSDSQEEGDDTLGRDEEENLEMGVEGSDDDEIGSQGDVLEEAEEEEEGGARDALLGSLQNLLDKKRAEEAGVSLSRGDAQMTAHERRLLRVSERARKLEEENMGEKQWFMQGEARAGARPLNSALEIDMDFDRALKPPPQPTEEFTSSLEDLIKHRIAEQQFDDPVRREAAPDLLQKQLAELDDKQAGKGLGEIYEEEFVRAKAGSVVEDKDEKTRVEARLVLQGLFAKLDALSHFHFAPKPIIKDMTVQREVPALVMEEVAPQVISKADRQLPEEVYRAAADAEAAEGQSQGRSERKRRRAAVKRSFKKAKEDQGDAPKKSLDGTNVIARKSAQKDAEDVAARKKSRMREKRKRSKQDDAPKMKYNKSARVFGSMQDAKSLQKPAKKTATAGTSNSLKL